jgi:two-component sensor histidine kinase
MKWSTSDVGTLATNAVKYGALSNAAGSILIEWTMETAPTGQRLLLNWNEKLNHRVKNTLSTVQSIAIPITVRQTATPAGPC